MSELLTETQARTITGHSASCFRKWRAAGVGPRWVKVMGRVYYPAPALAQFLKAAPSGGGKHSAQPAAEPAPIAPEV
jgi:hypothetical protein